MADHPFQGSEGGVERPLHRNEHVRSEQVRKAIADRSGFAAVMVIEGEVRQSGWFRPKAGDSVGRARIAYEESADDRFPHVGALREELFMGSGVQCVSWALDAVLTGIASARDPEA